MFTCVKLKKEWFVSLQKVYNGHKFVDVHETGKRNEKEKKINNKRKIYNGKTFYYILVLSFIFLCFFI